LAFIDLVLADDLVQGEQVGGERVDLIVGRASSLERHRPPDEIENGGGIAPEVTDGFRRLDGARERGAADENVAGGTALAGLAVAHRAFRGEDRRALSGGAAARGQSGAVGKDADVPGGDVRFGDPRPEAGRLGRRGAPGEGESEGGKRFRRRHA
jgi:hypothetical protein